MSCLSRRRHTRLYRAKAYGVWVEKSMVGRTYMGVERSTFVIDADGNVARMLRRVKPDAHVHEVLAVLPR